MGGYEHLTRDELISVIRELKEERERGHLHSDGPAEFPVFGARERWEFAASAWPIRIFDRETLQYLAVNDAALKFYGYTRDEFLTLTPLDTRVAEERTDLLNSLAEPTGYIRYLRSRRHVKKSGEIVVVELVIQDILFNRRKARLSLTLDVTERVRTQEKLRKREQEFRTLTDHLPDLVVRFDLEYRYVYTNLAVEKLLGRPQSELLGKTQRELGMPEKVTSDFTQSLVRVIYERKPHKLEFLMNEPEGKRIFEAHLVPESGPDNRVMTVLCIARDITERKQAEHLLRESKAWLDLAIESSGLGMWDWDIRTGLVRRNQILARILGYEQEETPDHINAWSFFQHPEDGPEVQRNLQEHFSGKTSEYLAQHRMQKKNGEWLWALCRGKLIERDEDGYPLRMIGCIQDITEQKRAEADRLTRAIRQRDTLVREVHHRIKNNLQGVTGLLRQKVRKYPAIASEIEEAIMQLYSVSAVYGLHGSCPGELLPLAKIVDSICRTTEDFTGCCVTKSYFSESPQPVCINNSEAVAVAVAINELVFNAVKHRNKTESCNGIDVSLREVAGGAEIRITNCGELPSQFDIADDRNSGEGLELVKTLLSQPGSDLEVSCADQEVKVVLKLTSPLVVMP